jgi:PAS domain S-box-containing protein
MFPAQQRPELPTISELQSLLSAERGALARLQGELELRSCALDAASTHFMIIDVSQPAWKIVYVNRAICERHGYVITDLLGQSPLMLISVEQSSAALERVSEAVRQGENVSVELVARRKDRTTFSVGMNMTPIDAAPAEVSHYVCVGADGERSRNFGPELLDEVVKVVVPAPEPALR